MSDIVDRLRDPLLESHWKLRHEAADEITRLRDKLAKCETDLGVTRQSLCEVVEQRNKALAELAAIKGQEPVAWMWQHDETGRVGFVDCWQVENGWQENNPRLHLVRKLYAMPVADKDAEPIPHKWDRDGERCVVCGAKDWMGGSCDAAMAKGE